MEEKIVSDILLPDPYKIYCNRRNEVSISTTDDEVSAPSAFRFGFFQGSITNERRPSPNPDHLLRFR